MWHRRAGAADAHEPAQHHNRDIDKAQTSATTSVASSASDTSFPSEDLLGGMHGAGGEYSVSTPTDAGAALGSLAGGVIGTMSAGIAGVGLVTAAAATAGAAGAGAVIGAVAGRMFGRARGHGHEAEHEHAH